MHFQNLTSSFSHAVLLPVLAFGALLSCSSPQSSVTAVQQSTSIQTLQPIRVRSLADGQASFERVKARILPIARQTCAQIHTENRAKRCGFNVQMVPNSKIGPNARFSRTKSGKLVISFNPAMLQFTSNDDELAMILAHEIGHQIARHIDRSKVEVKRGAKVGQQAAAKKGIDLTKGARAGAIVAFVAFSQKAELEADTLSAQIMLRAGYVPTHAVQIFDRMPQNSAQFKLHPGQRQRIGTIQKITEAFLRAEQHGTVLPLRF